MLNTLKTQAMKRLFKLGLMLVSALALTNCAEEINPPVQEDVNVDGNIESITPPEEEVDIPFEVFANFGESAETKTVNWGNATYWEGTDAISVYHKPKGASTYTHNSRFTVADVNKGLFTGSLKAALGETNDWYFFYPYPEGSSSAPTLNAVPVTIGESVLNIQAGSKAHIVGAKSPMYGVLNEVEMDKSPDISMNHLAAVLAFKIANNTNGPININNIELISPTPVVGNYIVDLTQTDNMGKINAPIKNTQGAVVSPFSPASTNNPTSIKITCPETEIIIAGGSATFYIPVCPNIIKIDNAFKIYVNGSEKTPQTENEITFEAGKVTTVRLEVNPLFYPTESDALGLTFTDIKDQSTKNVLSLFDIIDGSYTQITNPTARININNTSVPVYILGDKDDKGNPKTSIIRIEGPGSTLVNLLPAYFYASRFNDLETAMRLKKVDVIWLGEWLSKGAYSKVANYLGITLSDGITPDDLVALGFGTSKLTFSGMIPNCGFDSSDINNSKVLILDEECTSKCFDNAPKGNIETYLQIAGSTATIGGLIDIFNGNHTSDAAKTTGKVLYDFLNAKIAAKVSKYLSGIVLGLLGITSSGALMERLEEAQFLVEIETCPFPGATTQNPIVFWGLDATIPTK